MWGGSAVWNRSGQAQLHLFFPLRFFNPVQQVLRFHQFGSKPEEGLPVVPALQLGGGFEQAADVVQRLHAAGVHGPVSYTHLTLPTNREV